jgi:hypothetical protein
MRLSMHFPLKQLAAATLFAASLSALSSPAFANITPDQSTAILKSFSETSVTDFRGFLGTLAKGDMGKTSDVGPAINAFLDNKTLSADQQNEINRLLGIYTRVKYAAVVCARMGGAKDACARLGSCLDVNCALTNVPRRGSLTSQPLVKASS